MPRTKQKKSKQSTKSGGKTKSKTRGSEAVVKPIAAVTPKSNGRAKADVKPNPTLPSSSNGRKPKGRMKPMLDLASLCTELQGLQRQRAIYIKSRVMMDNRLTALIAGTQGYYASMTEKDREKAFDEARGLIGRVMEGEGHELRELICLHGEGTARFREVQKRLSREMLVLARQFPVAKWMAQPEQAGVSLEYLSVIIGETGDLCNYANPAKVWRRLGCAPWTFDGRTKMGATWKGGKEGKLPAVEWEKFGYSPRRRSIAYIIGEDLVKQNGADSEESAKKKRAKGHKVRTLVGPYRIRYDEAKASAGEKHPEWLVCSKCKGTGREGKSKCKGCKGTGEVWKRCHLHGMLLATKLFLKNLWIEWNSHPEGGWREVD